jgi:vanillate O-demethylase monooxygenase subunit
MPRIRPLHNGLLFERWFRDHPLTHGKPLHVDTFNSLRYLLPGIFLMTTEAFSVGTAAASDYGEPRGTPLFRRVEQQSVTPTGDRRSRYLYATGIETKSATPQFLDAVFGVIDASFAEDKRIIEAQQKVLNETPADRKKAFIPQDKAPAMFRKMIEERLAAEAKV